MNLSTVSTNSKVIFAPVYDYAGNVVEIQKQNWA